MRRWLVCLPLLAACEHSAPFTAPPNGAGGPLSDAAPFFLTVDSIGSFAWSADEDAIVLHIPRRPPISPPDPRGWTGIPHGLKVGNCLLLLPPGGGSARWRRCEVAPEAGDSTALIGAAGAGTGGRIVFVRTAQPRSLTFPVGSRIDLWVTDTAYQAIPRRLETLYRDSLGISRTPPGQVNWYDAIRFLDGTRFLARGLHLRPDASREVIGWRLGELRGDSVAWIPVPTVLANAVPIPVQEGAALLWWTASGQVRLATLDGGVRADGAVPVRAPATSMASVACRGSTCLALTRGPAGPEHDRFLTWRITLPDLAIDSIGTFLAAPQTPVAASARRGSVLGVTNRRLVLHPDVLPALP